VGYGVDFFSLDKVVTDMDVTARDEIQVRERTKIFPHIAFRLREIDEEWAGTARMNVHYGD
jgi:hypothetical protein